MSKFRRNNICSSPRNRHKASNDGISDISTSVKLKLNKNKLMSHGEFLNRIQKSLYYGGRMSIPLSDYVANKFSDTHKGYSLNRLNYSTVGSLRSTPCSLILAMIYLERLKDADPTYTKHVTPTELFLVSMMVATKFYSGHDDEAPYVNWAECSNTTSDNLLQMELLFLNAIDWKIYVSNEEFFEKVKSLELILARQQGTKHGYTYLELSSLMPSIQIAKEFIQCILVLSISYTILVVTMVASVYLVSQIPGTCLNVSSQTSTTQLSLRNSSYDDFIIMFWTTSEVKQQSTKKSNESASLNTALDRTSDYIIHSRKQSNTTIRTPSLFPLLHSLLKIESFKGPVITSELALKYNGINANFFCNSSVEEVPTSSVAERFKLSLNGNKMK